MESTTTPRVAAPPAYGRRDYLAIPLVLLAVALYFRFGHHLPVPGAFGDVDRRSGQAVFNEWVLLAAVVTGFYFVFGIAGRFAFSTAAFMGLGAYTSHYVTRGSDLSWFVGLLAAVVVAAVIGAGFAVLLRHAQHFYFAVATLGLGEILLLVFHRFERLTGRPSGEIVRVVEVDIFGYSIDSRDRAFYLLLAFLGVVLLLGALIERSPLAREAIAARDNPTVARTLGGDPAVPGIVLFTLGCVIAAAAGVLFVHTRRLGTPETFGLELGIGIFVALILGGMHSLWGPLVGSWVYVYVPLYLEAWERWTLVLWGTVLVFVMIVFPDGLVGLLGRVRAAWRRRRPLGASP